MGRKRKGTTVVGLALTLIGLAHCSGDDTPPPVKCGNVVCMPNEICNQYMLCCPNKPGNSCVPISSGQDASADAGSE
jgi:hypothetical protein